jgi:sugar-specific transcriptional regulator TrmB
MPQRDLTLLAEAGFNRYERQALLTLGQLGVADAATLCREGDIPTSKIYLAMEKLAELGLCEVQRTRPKLYSAVPPDVVVDRLVELMRERAEQFAARSSQLKEALASVPVRLRGRQSIVDVALGTESHVKRHLTRVASARERVLSYLEEGDLAAIDDVAGQGFDVLKRIARVVAERRIDYRVVFGFSDRAATRLIAFLRSHAPDLNHLSGVRYSGELGHPFHVIDGEVVILSLDHPFVPEGRFASLLVKDPALAAALQEGFEKLWQKALRDLREIKFYPRPPRT